MLPWRSLGQTDIRISPLGLGTVKFGRNQGVKYPGSFQLPEDAQLQQLLDICREFNINLLDTAPAYGYSEERLGSLLKKGRQDWVISTKVGEEFEADKNSDQGKSWFDFSAKHTRLSVERSLRRLNTDYLDLVLIHSDGNDLQVLAQTPVVATLEQLKREGWIRAFGASTKTLEGGLLAAELCDAVMVTYNQQAREEAAVIERCSQLGKGVLLKKVFASGHICHDSPPQSDPVAAALEFALGKAGVSSAIVGSINPQHLRDNALKALIALRP